MQFIKFIGKTSNLTNNPTKFRNDGAMRVVGDFLKLLGSDAGYRMLDSGKKWKSLRSVIFY